MDKLSYHRHRYPSIVIQQAIWLYFRFSLSYRDVEDMLAERGIDVSYETVRLGFEVRRHDCPQAETRTVSAGRAVASRRSVCLHQRQTVVRLACCGQRRRGPGYPGSTAARSQGGAQADAKTLEEVRRHSRQHRDRQARILPLGAARTW